MVFFAARTKPSQTNHFQVVSTLLWAFLYGVNWLANCLVFNGVVATLEIPAGSLLGIGDRSRTQHDSHTPARSLRLCFVRLDNPRHHSTGQEALARLGGRGTQ